MAAQCFVVMPFAPEYNGIWQHVIRPTVVSIGHECLRADDIFAPGPIINDVVTAIRGCTYVIADISERNPNVYYELGLAHAFGKPTILLARDLSSLPFDLRHQRTIEYSDTASGAHDLREALMRYLQSINRLSR